MLIKVNSVSIRGLETSPVVVEVNVSNRGLPRFDIVGLGDKSVAESKYRIKTAFQNSSINFPNKKITVNLAPAYIIKEGTHYDLPIAVGILCAIRGFSVPKDSLFFGELSLEGTIKQTRGAFLLALTALENNIKSIFVSHESVSELLLIKGVTKYGVESLNALDCHLDGRKKIGCAGCASVSMSDVSNSYPHHSKASENVFIDTIVGQEFAKRALMLSAAGGHNLILTGPPGSGKSMLAKSLQSILPPLNEKEAVEVLKIRSASGGTTTSNFYERPFRSPHHSTSFTGMIGGGVGMTIGEITLAHRGILFMDEFNLFRKDILESLRVPLEDGLIKITRSRGTVIFPSRFTLVATCNPCPCGRYMQSDRRCTCTPYQISTYLRRLSGPVLDRIDLHLNVQSVSVLNLSQLSDAPFTRNYNVEPKLTGGLIKVQVYKARKIQAARFKDCAFTTNSEMSSEFITSRIQISKESRKILNFAVEKYGLSTRSYFKIIKIAQTIADLELADRLEDSHILEALQYRTRIQP